MAAAKTDQNIAVIDAYRATPEGAALVGACEAYDRAYAALDAAYTGHGSGDIGQLIAAFEAARAAVATARERYQVTPTGAGPYVRLDVHPAELRDRRVKLGLTQAALATRLDVTANTVARWERGELAIARPQLVRAMLHQLEEEHASA